MQQPTYSYSNSSSSRSILKKGQSATSASRRRLQFEETPKVYCVTPIEEEDYYGGYVKMSREERRWQRR
jgi:N6-L-threonylcarbamoyladenine synthase